MVIRGGADSRGALVTDRKLDRSRKLSAISWFCFTPLKYHILRLLAADFPPNSRCVKCELVFNL